MCFPGGATGKEPVSQCTTYKSPSPGDLPDPGIEPVFAALKGGFFTTEPAGTPHAEF